MKVTFKRFGLPYNPQKDKKNKNKIIRHIVWFLIAFIDISVLLTLVVEALIRISIAKLAINDTIDSTWIGSLASYWGGIIGGMISGTLAFIGVFYTIRYYKESDEQKEKVREASEKVAILRSANMSLGINVLAKLLKEAARQFAPAGFDMEIVEKHHNLKKDAPSGTAILLADSMNEALDSKYDYVYDRSTRNEKRPQYEIGISSVRAGNIPGDHDVIFAGEDEVITFSHRAYSKAVFGRGAVQAAVFIKGKKPGMYDMSMVVGGN